MKNIIILFIIGCFLISGCNNNQCKDGVCPVDAPAGSK
jgi:hypothetical protein